MEGEADYKYIKFKIPMSQGPTNIHIYAMEWQVSLGIGIFKQ